MTGQNMTQKQDERTSGRTAFLCHPIFLEHDTGPRHPESTRRLTAILDKLAETGIADSCLRIRPEAATVNDIALIHNINYIKHLAAQSEKGVHFHEDSDTVGSSATYLAARTAAGAAIKAVDLVMTGEAVNAFCAVRPPGHHAERDHAMGFCFFNNIAVATRRLVEKYNLKRVAIIDWDVHHGNGTQNSFYDDPRVLYASIHQYPHYPGTGRSDEAGTGPGRGFTFNMPMPAGATDTDFTGAFRERLSPEIDKFKPEFILISAGFDAHIDDPLSDTLVTTEGFGALTDIVADMAERHCAGRLVSILEGGYNLAALGESVAAHISALLQKSKERNAGTTL